MKSLNEIKRVLALASIVLGEQAGGDPPPPWEDPANWLEGWPGDFVWTPEMIALLGQNIINTEQLGDWHYATWVPSLEAGQIPGGTDIDGGFGSGNIQPGMWAQAWGYPCCPLSEANLEIYNAMVIGGDGYAGQSTQYWIGVTAMMYLLAAIEAGGDTVTWPENCDLMCMLELIYSVYLRGPEGQGADQWGKIADNGLLNFLKNWARLMKETGVTEEEEETEEEETEEEETVTVKPGDTLWGISKGNIQPWITANPNIVNPNAIIPGQILKVP